MTDENTQSDMEKMFGGFAPKLVSLTDGVLFGDVWNAKGSLLVIGALPRSPGSSRPEISTS
jgi:hypothetical protein